MCSISDSEKDKVDITIEMEEEANITENTESDNSDNETLQEEINDANNITPRKQAKYQSPKRKKLTRKQTSNPHTWKKHVRKQKRQSGQEYTTV